MVDRPILRVPDPQNAERRRGRVRTPPRPRGPGGQAQGRRFQPTFDALAAAFQADDPTLVLRQDPAGLAPERALVFVTAGSVQDFARAAQGVGLEVFTETEIEEIEDYPDGFEPVGEGGSLSRTLYATMPTLDSFQRILTLWNVHQSGERMPHGDTPWRHLFDLLLELRPWGPEDRLGPDARAVIERRLPLDDDELVSIEFEVWPTTNVDKRTAWRAETEQRIAEVGGEVRDTSSISDGSFVYEAVLTGVPARAVRAMLENPSLPNGLATLEGVQFVTPQMTGQAEPEDLEGQAAEYEPQGAFTPDAPIRGALLDGTPVAAHPALDGGITIEDIHDLVRLSPVERRIHATAMASLILRGDLDADGRPISDTRLVSVPLLVDSRDGSWSPRDRLFVDLLHTTLVRLFDGEGALAPEIFVVNFSIGVNDMRFTGRISALARLMDWWAVKKGALFIISAGNVGDDLRLQNTNSVEFEDADAEE